MPLILQGPTGGPLVSYKVGLPTRSMALPSFFKHSSSLQKSNLHSQVYFQKSISTKKKTLLSHNIQTHNSTSKMYTIAPPHRFLVLSAASSAPFNPANQFLVLSPTESGPDPRIYDEQAITESSDGVQPVPKERRSDSSSSMESELNDILPSGFLYLGHTSRRYSQ